MSELIGTYEPIVTSNRSPTYLPAISARKDNGINPELVSLLDSLVVARNAAQKDNDFNFE